MKQWLLLATVILCMATFVWLASGQTPATSISFEQILKNPDSYHGKLIEVTGFLVDEFENSALYSNKSWRRNRGIWIEPNDEMLKQRPNLKNHYLKLTGRFNAHQHGHLGQYRGTLTVVRFAFAEEPRGQ